MRFPLISWRQQGYGRRERGRIEMKSSRHGEIRRYQITVQKYVKQKGCDDQNEQQH